MCFICHVDPNDCTRKHLWCLLTRSATSGIAAALNKPRSHLHLRISFAKSLRVPTEFAQAVPMERGGVSTCARTRLIQMDSDGLTAWAVNPGHSPNAVGWVAKLGTITRLQNTSKIITPHAGARKLLEAWFFIHFEWMKSFTACSGKEGLAELRMERQQKDTVGKFPQWRMSPHKLLFSSRWWPCWGSRFKEAFKHWNKSQRCVLICCKGRSLIT